MVKTLREAIVRTFVAIEHNSGLVWGATSAETGEAACSDIDSLAGNTPAVAWERVLPIRCTDGGYHLYVAPDGADVTDLVAGDYAIVETLEHVGDYRPVSAVQ